jgi:tetratricopeptide (TPR) repeat protein
VAPLLPARARLPVAAVAALLLPFASPAWAQPGSPRGETRKARDQARLCERKQGEEGLAACRSALALGLGPERRGPVRELLARRLVQLERWSELADHYREDVRRRPEDATAWHRLGSTLLFALDDAPEAVAALQEAVRLGPDDAGSRVALALALDAVGRYAEASAAFDEALHLNPGVLDGRPAAQAVREAALRGKSWP